MKYKKLYNLAHEKKNVIFRVKDYPDKIAIPHAGFVVRHPDNVPLPVEDEHDFDDAIDSYLRQFKRHGEPRFLVLDTTDIIEGTVMSIEPVRLHKDRKIATGFALGVGADSILDLATSKKIWIQE